MLKVRHYQFVFFSDLDNVEIGPTYDLIGRNMP